MTISILRKLVQFNAWANHKVLVKALALPLDELTAIRVPGQRSMLELLLHILDTQWYWRCAMKTGILPKKELVAEDFPTLKALRLRWELDDRELSGFLEAVNAIDADPLIYYKWESDRKNREPRCRHLSDIVLHIVMHAAQHRSELAYLLTLSGKSPGELDFIKFFSMDQYKKVFSHE